MKRFVLSLVLCFFGLGTFSSPAKSIGFGTDEKILHVADTRLSVPPLSSSQSDIFTRNENYKLGIKYTQNLFFLPFYIGTDGYVLYHYNRYVEISDDEIKTYQRIGLIPARLPEVSLGLLDYFFGFSLEIVLAFVFGLQITGNVLEAKARKAQEIQKNRNEYAEADSLSGSPNHHFEEEHSYNPPAPYETDELINKELQKSIDRYLNCAKENFAIDLDKEDSSFKARVQAYKESLIQPCLNINVQKDNAPNAAPLDETEQTRLAVKAIVSAEITAVAMIKRSEGLSTQEIIDYFVWEGLSVEDAEMFAEDGEPPVDKSLKLSPGCLVFIFNFIVVVYFIFHMVTNK